MTAFNMRKRLLQRKGTRPELCGSRQQLHLARTHLLELTVIFRLLMKSWIAEYVEKESYNPFLYGPWELDIHDLSPATSHDQLAEMEKGIRAPYLSARAKEKAALSPATGTSAPGSHKDDEDLRNIEDDEALAADRDDSASSGATSPNDEDATRDGIVNAPNMELRVPSSTRARLIADLKKREPDSTFTDKTGKIQENKIKFIPI
ncbi:hypothetical protein KVR01_010223 [Diaporthe batatas]|uniref:uncharacterized protein n=1 Tax=Diaporthe batatas TaxID=748121 RepID=UPI001D03FE19|nr:uncharacterized protein KVR01_010223 [Diaporthe batatas]KAG8159586.1 hypothetical protein KVR01_010223 [Diaporthe batatas]